MDLMRYIRVVPNWPKQGISFKDITPLLRDARAFRSTIFGLTQPFRSKRVDVVVGIDARGFLLAGAVAQQLRCGVALVRKGGKLPWKTVKKSYALEYGAATLEMHRDAVKRGERVLVVDDILATGGTASAACRLVEKVGGKVVGCAFVIELEFLRGRDRLPGRHVTSLVRYA